MADNIEQQAAALDAEVEMENPENVDNISGPENVETQSIPAIPQPLNNPDELAAAIGMAVGMLVPMFPSLKEVYTPETINQVAQASCMLANKRSWNLLGMIKGWAEELQFAGVMFPVAIATYKAIDKDMTAREAAKKKKAESEDSMESVKPSPEAETVEGVNSVISGQA